MANTLGSRRRQELSSLGRLGADEKEPDELGSLPNTGSKHTDVYIDNFQPIIDLAFHLWETDLAIYFDQRILSVEAKLPALLCNLLILQLNEFCVCVCVLFPDPKALLPE